MKNIRFNLLFVLLCVLPLLSVSAQNQRGYTKTRGRLNADGSVMPGKRLPEVVISFMDGRTSVMSDAGGDFSFPVRDETYVLKEVRKNGYQLLDPDALNRAHHYSSREPLVLTLETEDAILEDQLAAERLVRRQLEIRLQRSEAELDTLKARRSLTAEEYRERLRQLFDSRSRSEQLVKEMAERYSTIDFDLMDDFYREVSACILRGELLRADSLLNRKGDLGVCIESYRELAQSNAREQEEFNRRKRALDRRLHYAERALQDLALECYSRYEIAKLRFRNDSAAFYIEQRAALDTTNAEWQFQAGTFLRDYMADYDRARFYYYRALRNAGNDEERGICYNDLGVTCNSMGNYTGALEFLNKALAIEALLGETERPNRATIYSNIGVAYSYLGAYDQALDYLLKGLDVQQKISGMKAPGVALTCNSIGLVYCYTGDFSRASEYLGRALSIQLEILGERHPDTAATYSNLGNLFIYQGDYARALEHLQKALDIQRSVFGERHPETATSYNSLGVAYDYMGDTARALEYYTLALEIQKETLGENHLAVATSYNNIGYIYFYMGDNTRALDFYEKALAIYRQIQGEESIDSASCYNNIAGVYSRMGDNARALEYYERALVVRTSLLGEKHPDIAVNYNGIGSVLSAMGKPQEALEAFGKALEIRKELLGDTHPDTAVCYSNIGTVYSDMGDYVRALEYLEKSLAIRLAQLGPSHVATANSTQGIGRIYYFMGNYVQALEYFEKALSIYRSSLPETHPSVVRLKEQIAQTKEKLAHGAA